MAIMSRFLILLSIVCAVALAAEDGNATAKIAKEIERIERAWKEAPPPGSGMDGLMSGSQASLKSAREALDAGRIYVALERLAQAEDLLGGFREVAGKTEAVTSGLPAFEVEWSKANSAVAGLSRDARGANWNNAPAALRAISETSLGRSVPLLDGGRGFATALAPKDGLFYLGEARAQAEFARFCASLRLSSNGRPWPARSMLPELLALQAKVDAAFVPPRSIEQHPRFIALNSAIKLARELDATKSYHGALYQYLEAVRHFGMLDAAPVDAAGQASLKASVEAEHRRLESSEADDSIPQIFLERAETASGADEWRSAAVTMSQVLPAYAATLKSAPELHQTAGKTVDVTLVRWPYT
jgi:hypothetical protein